MRAGILVFMACVAPVASATRSIAAIAAPPVCGPGQWVLSGPPIGDGLAGSTVQTLVLDGAGRLAITGACPAIAAKLKGTKDGTAVKAAWPAGFCGGVGVKAKVIATIDPSCATMHGKFSAAKLHEEFDATRSPCDVGSVDTGGVPRCVDPAVATGTGSIRVTLDKLGCLAADALVTTDTGISAKLDAGSCILTPGKKTLRGDVEIALDDAGGPPGAAGVAGLVRLRVRPKGKGVPIVAAVEPPATLALPLGDLSIGGTWFSNAFLDDAGFTTVPHGASPVLLDAVPIVGDGPEHLALGIAGPLGLSFEPAASAATVHARAAMQVVSLAIPADPNLPDPRVQSWELINPKTAQIVIVGIPQGGLGVGESDTNLREGHTYTATMLESGGQRRVEVTSDFSNRFHLLLALRDGTNNNVSTVDGDAVGGCPDETCLSDSYVGFVKVEAHAKNVAEVVNVQGAIAALLPAGARVVIRSIASAGKAKRAVMSIFGLAGSVRGLAAGLPTSWAVSTSDRTLTVDTHPANVLGEWQGTMEITSISGFVLGCPPSDPLCARLTVQSGPNGLRIAYCNGVETFCSTSAATQQCSLLFDGAPAPGGFAATGVNNNPPCCIGCVGQQRVYGCQLTATLTVNGSQQTLEGSFPGSVTFCPSAPTPDDVVTHFRVCRPKPCAVP